MAVIVDRPVEIQINKDMSGNISTGVLDLLYSPFRAPRSCFAASSPSTPCWLRHRPPAARPSAATGRCRAPGRHPVVPEPPRSDGSPLRGRRCCLRRIETLFQLLHFQRRARLVHRLQDNFAGDAILHASLALGLVRRSKLLDGIGELLFRRGGYYHRRHLRARGASAHRQARFFLPSAWKAHRSSSTHQSASCCSRDPIYLLEIY